VPLGGYVKITGMNPNERIPPEIAHRAYFAQPVWKRVVVIAAGPFMNFLIAFAIIWVLLLSLGQVRNALEVNFVDAGSPRRRAAARRRPDPVDRRRAGRRAGPDRDADPRPPDRACARSSPSTRCAGAPTEGCSATTPARVVVQRDGGGDVCTSAPSTTPPRKTMLLGIGYGAERRHRARGTRAASPSPTCGRSPRRPSAGS
jgi:regulator of sigma E protease